MSTYINTNTTAYQASLNLNANTSAESVDIQRLSTGLKINSAADSPAGLVTAQSEAAQLAGLNAATDNTNTAINLTQTAEGALNQVQTLLVSIRQLAVAASQTATNNTTELAADQAQINSAVQSINNISSTTQFNNVNLLSGAATAAATITPGSATLAQSAAGATANTTILNQGTWTSSTSAAALAVTAATASTIASAANTGLTASSGFAGSLTINGTVYQIGNNAVGGTSVGLSQLNNSIAASGYQASVSGTTFTLTSTVAGALTPTVTATNLNYAAAPSGNLGAVIANPLAATGAATVGAAAGATVTGLGASTSSTIVGSNTIFNFSNGLQIETATPTAGASLGTVTSVAGTSSNGQNLEFQIGANEGQNVSLSIQSTAANQLGTGAANYTNAAGATVTPTTQNVAGINVTTFQGAQDAIAVVDQALNQVSTIRANLGAFQTNILQSNATSLGVQTTNTLAAQATTEDTDVASQVVDYTKNQILVSAATSALTYANQQPQSILKLLQ
jgi:flagellin